MCRRGQDNAQPTGGGSPASGIQRESSPPLHASATVRAPRPDGLRKPWCCICTARVAEGHTGAALPGVLFERTGRPSPAAPALHPRPHHNVLVPPPQPSPCGAPPLPHQPAEGCTLDTPFPGPAPALTLQGPPSPSRLDPPVKPNATPSTLKRTTATGATTCAWANPAAASQGASQLPRAKPCHVSSAVASGPLLPSLSLLTTPAPPDLPPPNAEGSTRRLPHPSS